MKRSIALALVLSFLFFFACAELDRRSDYRPPSIKVSRVVLYQNGVGYFERRGELEKNTFSINVRNDQINDVLKSLAVIDLSKGRAINVSLPIEKGKAEQLAELPDQVKNASGLMDVLRVFRGATVTVRGRSTVTGRVLGIEKIDPYKDTQSIRAFSTDDGASSGWRATFMEAGGKLRIVPIEDIEELTIRDRTLEVGLKKSLDISLDEGKWKPVELTIRLTDAPMHKLLLSYITEMPRWKPSYRIVTSDKDWILLQGWAVVDNVSGEDWEKVKLSLVAGAPLSFRYDLHSPQFIKRVDLSPRRDVYAAAPPSEGAGYAMEKKKGMKAEKSFRSRKRSISSDMDASMLRAKPGAAPARSRYKDGEAMYEEEYEDYEEPEAEINFLDMSEEFSASVGGEEISSLFRYDVAGPVTVRDNSSTMVSIINAKVPGQDVWLFRPEDSGGQAEIKPFRAVRLTNDSGYTLEKGPVALYSQDTFVGEGFLERQEKAATTFISYARDAKVSLSFTTGDSEEAVSLLKIANGMVHAETLSIRRAEYKLKNRHEEAGTAFVRRDKMQGWNLRKAPKGTIETSTSYYVPVKVPASGDAKLTVEFVTPVRRRLAIDTDLSTTVLKLFLGSGKAPDNIKKEIEEILSIKSKIATLTKERRLFYRNKNEYGSDQRRLRSNLELLRKTPGNKDLVRELVSKLARLERKLGKLSAKIVKADENIAGLRARLDVIIRDVSLSNEKK